METQKTSHATFIIDLRTPEFPCCPSPRFACGIFVRPEGKELGVSSARLIVLIALVGPPALYGASRSQVKIDTGTVEGRASGSVRAFLGIPYAAPPVGDLRWKPPAPAIKWTGVRSAREF